MMTQGNGWGNLKDLSGGLGSPTSVVFEWYGGGGILCFTIVPQ